MSIPTDLSLDLTKLKNEFLRSKSNESNENNSSLSNTQRTTSSKHKLNTHRKNSKSNTVIQRIKTTVTKDALNNVLDHNNWTNRYDVRSSLQQYMSEFKSEIQSLTQQLVTDAEQNIDTVDTIDLQLVQQLKQMELNFDSTIKQIDTMNQLEIDNEKQRLAAMGKNPNTVNSMSPRSKLLKEKAQWSTANNIYEQLSSKDLTALLQIQQELQSKQTTDKPSKIALSDIQADSVQTDTTATVRQNDQLTQLQQYIDTKKQAEQKKQYDQYIRIKQRQADIERRKQLQALKQQQLQQHREQYEQAKLLNQQTEAENAAYLAEEQRILAEIEQQRVADEQAEQQRQEQEKQEELDRVQEQQQLQELLKIEQQQQELQQKYAAEKQRITEQQQQFEAELKERERAEQQAAKLAQQLERSLKQLQQEPTNEKELEQLQKQLQAETSEQKHIESIVDNDTAVIDENNDVDTENTNDINQQFQNASITPTPPTKQNKVKSMKFAADKSTVSNYTQQFQTTKLKQSVYKK